MKICLVNPPLITRKGLRYTLLGLSYIAAVLKHDYDIYAADAQFQSRQNIIQSAKDADVVGITSMSCNFPGAETLAYDIKKVNPTATVVMGGAHATFTDVKVLQKNPHIDIIVRHEGEYTMLELLHALETDDISHVRGITYRREDKIKRNPERRFITDLDNIPFPARDLWQADNYYKEGSLPQIISARGCPHTCIFCSTSSMWGHRIRLRSPKNVVDEIEYVVKKYRVNEISFVDDTFTILRSHTSGICREILKRGLDITWGCNVRADALDDDLLQLMKKAGLNYVFMGVESGNQKTLDFMNKNITISQTQNALTLAKKYSIKVALSCILGFPNETYADVQRTIDFMISLNGDSYLFNFLLLFPGTELYERQKELKIKCIVENPWKRIEKTPFTIPTIETENLSFEELCQLYLEARSTLLHLTEKEVKIE